jgi:hypothetical protein
VLAYLLDEHVAPAVAAGIVSRRPDVRVTTLRDWRGGALLATDDATILLAAAADGLTLVTFDLRTIPPLLRDWMDQGTSNGGFVFVHRRTIPSKDIGGLIRALVWLWDEAGAASWADRVAFLRADDG